MVPQMKMMEALGGWKSMRGGEQALQMGEQLCLLRSLCIEPGGSTVDMGWNDSPVMPKLLRIIWRIDNESGIQVGMLGVTGKQSSPKVLLFKNLKKFKIMKAVWKKSIHKWFNFSYYMAG